MCYDAARGGDFDSFIFRVGRNSKREELKVRCWQLFLSYLYLYRNKPGKVD